MNLSVYGTDEFTHGQTGHQTAAQHLRVYAQRCLLATCKHPWNRAYAAINTCNGVIERGAEAADLSDAQKTALLAEAKYLRAHWYFILATTFGGDDVGSWLRSAKFNTTPTNVAHRESLADCWAAIMKDLEEAAAELPDRPSAQGRAWKAKCFASSREGIPDARLVGGFTVYRLPKSIRYRNETDQW